MQYGQCKTRFIRISPSKARPVADLVRDLSVLEALNTLAHTPRKAARLLLRSLRSAVANAESNYEVSREQLFITELRVDEGPRLKRAKARNRGGRSPILKRMSHFTITVGTKLGE